MENKDTVKFSRLLYKNNIYSIIEFEVNGELKLWYNLDNLDNYQGWNKPDDFNEALSNNCILQEQTNLSFLFYKSPITHFDVELLNVEDTRWMFDSCIDLIYFKSKMSNVKKTKKMFYNCSEEFFQKHPHLRDL